MSHDLGLVTRAYAGYDSGKGWNQIYRAGVHLTKEQIVSFVEEYQNLLWKYVTEPGQHPEGSRGLAVRLIVVPEEESTED
jgi:hypothetical protein